MGRVVSSFVQYTFSCTYTCDDIVKHIQTRISGSCTGVQMEEVYRSTLFLSRILFQKLHIHSGLQRTTSLGYPPQLLHRRRQDIHSFIHSPFHPFKYLFILSFIIHTFIFYFLSPFIDCIKDIFLEPHVFSGLCYSVSAKLFYVNIVLLFKNR